MKPRAALERELAETRAVLNDLLEDRGEAPLVAVRRKAQWTVIGSLFESANDFSLPFLEELLLDAGWLWRCREEMCGYLNPHFVEECEAGGCHGRRPNDPRLRRSS